jgi:hypothetical protein
MPNSNHTGVSRAEYTCASCAYFHPSRLEHTYGQIIADGQCRRHAPVWTLPPDPNEFNMAGWPWVMDDAWCGEWAGTRDE